MYTDLIDVFIFLRRLGLQVLILNPSDFTQLQPVLLSAQTSILAIRYTASQISRPC